MKDKIFLIITAILCAIVCAMFWRITQKWGFFVLMALTYISLLADNFRLRQKLKKSGVEKK